MRTADEIILEIQELPPEERQKVADYLNAGDGGEFLEEDYSPEDIAKLDRIQDEVERGINIIGPFSGTEAIEYLKKL